MTTTVAVVKTHWSGTSGGPGISQFCFQGQTGFGGFDAAAAQVLVNAVRTFWDADKNTLPNEVSLVVDPNVDVFEIVLGTLVGSFSAATPPATVTGTNTGSYSMASGAKINFRTTTIANGRRVRGGVFIVPCGSDVFDTNGQVSSTPRTNWVNHIGTMKSTAYAALMDHVVWSRPTTSSSNDGGSSVVTSYDVPSKGAILRGRRD